MQSLLIILENSLKAMILMVKHSLKFKILQETVENILKTLVPFKTKSVQNHKIKNY